jgi:hypothetical protein
MKLGFNNFARFFIILKSFFKKNGYLSIFKIRSSFLLNKLQEKFKFYLQNPLIVIFILKKLTNVKKFHIKKSFSKLNC